MAEIRYVKDAEKSFLASLRNKGAGKSETTRKNILKETPEERKQRRSVGRPSKDEIVKSVLLDETVEYFKKILPDDMEAKFWSMFLAGRVPMMDKDGNHVRDNNGVPQFHELSGVSWNAFKQMVAYKRGMPAIKVEKTPGSGEIVVNFNVMGASPQAMERQVKEMGLLPENGS